MERESEESLDDYADYGDDPSLRDEAEAAGNEAAHIGGDVPRQSDDPAFEAAAEGGEGEAEGFEQAEEELIEGASHGDPQPDPERLAFSEEEDDRTTADYGEPDEEEPQDL